MPVDHTKAAVALARAIAYSNSGMPAEAHEHAVRLVQMFVDAGILEDGFAGLEAK